MKLKNLFYLLLALPLAFASCSDLLGDDTQKEEPKLPKLTVTSALEVEVEAEGGTQMITYTLENAPEGAAVAATCEAEWITDLTVASSIIYEVAANEGDAREATIVVSYEEQSFNVVVKQAAKPASTVLRFEVTAESTIEFDCNAFSGSIGYILENPIEGVEVAAVSNQDWVEVTAIADGAIDFTAQANEGDAREATITVSYGVLDPVVITLKQAQYIDPSEVKTPFVITEVRAETTATDEWSLFLFENDALLGECITRLVVKLPEANPLHITPGTYTMAEGSILPNNPAVDATGGSYYRYNSDGAAILSATLTVEINVGREVAHLVGEFSVGNTNYVFEWGGAVKGFIYEEIGDEGITEWKSFTTRWLFDECYSLSATAANGTTFSMYIHDWNSSKSNHGTCPTPGEYIVSDYTKEYNYIEKTSSFGIINSNDLSSGTLTVADNGDGTTTISFDLIDDKGTEWKGSYTGAL